MFTHTRSSRKNGVRRMSRTTMAAAALGLGLAFTAVAPLAAHAGDPVDLAGAYVLDDAGVLGAGEADQVKVALDSLYAETGMQLFVVYTDRFDGTETAKDWADITSEQSGLGDSDALLAIAVDDRAYYVSVFTAFPLSDDELAGVEDSSLIPELRNDNWGGAATAFANALSVYKAPAAAPSYSSSPLPKIDFGPILLVLLAIAVIIAIIVVIVLAVGARRRRIARELAQKQLDQKVGAMLIAVDDALKSSEDELGFAVAQFGEDATAEFATALSSAKASAAEAFTIRQRLDDAFPETHEEKRQLGLRIVELCERADAVLDAQAEAFEALRELEANAPKILDSIDAATAVLTSRVPAVEKALASMTDKYSVAALATVDDNVDQAKALLDQTITGAAASRATLGNGSVAVAVRTAQAGAAQAAKLLDAVERLAADLVEAQRDLDSAVADLGRDLVETRAVPGNELDAAIDTAAAGLAAAVPGSERDPIDALHRIERLDGALTAALGELRARQEREARARAALDRLSKTTAAQIATTEQYISSHRSKIDSDARTRLSNAATELSSAIAHDVADPEGGLAIAQRAEQLVGQALKLARDDVDRANRPAPSYSSGSSYSGGFSSSSSSFGGGNSSHRGGGSSFSSGGGGHRGGGGRF
jgi:uncharacterized membrane protein YgcG